MAVELSASRPFIVCKAHLKHINTIMWENAHFMNGKADGTYSNNDGLKGYMSQERKQG
jgi:hypothetical protein